jgi:CubicO group peptidase (beta-lactamase class C family)
MALFGKFWDRIAPQPDADRRDAGPAAAIDDCVRSQIRDGDPGLAIAVAKAGAIAHAAGYGLADLRAGKPITPDTISHLASCGKQFTALGILMLAEAGRLNLDDPVSRHLPALAGFGPQVTIRRLLEHTSGIRDLYDEKGSHEVLARCERPTNADIIRTYAELGCPMAARRRGAGDAFSYSNSGYELLGSVIEAASGQSYHDFFQSRVFDPLGMRDTFSIPDRRVNDPRRAVGYASGTFGRLVACGGTEFDDLVGSGSFYTTVVDLCRYDRALATNALISAASMRAALTSGRTNDGQETGVGWGWYLASDESGRFADHEGEWDGYYSYICRYLDRPLSLFLLSNNPDVNLIEVADVAASVYG